MPVSDQTVTACSGEGQVVRDGHIWYTYKGAAIVANRHIRKIRQWAAEGMPTEVDALGRRVVREDILFAEKRRRLRRNPVHQARLKKILAESQANTDTNAHPDTQIDSGFGG